MMMMITVDEGVVDGLRSLLNDREADVATVKETGMLIGQEKGWVDLSQPRPRTASCLTGGCKQENLDASTQRKRDRILKAIMKTWVSE